MLVMLEGCRRPPTLFDKSIHVRMHSSDFLKLSRKVWAVPQSVDWYPFFAVTCLSFLPGTMFGVHGVYLSSIYVYVLHLFREENGEMEFLRSSLHTSVDTTEIIIGPVQEEVSFLRVSHRVSERMCSSTTLKAFQSQLRSLHVHDLGIK